MLSASLVPRRLFGLFNSVYSLGGTAGEKTETPGRPHISRPGYPLSKHRPQLTNASGRQAWRSGAGLREGFCTTGLLVALLYRSPPAFYTTHMKQVGVWRGRASCWVPIWHTGVVYGLGTLPVGTGAECRCMCLFNGQLSRAVSIRRPATEAAGLPLCSLQVLQ